MMENNAVRSWLPVFCPSSRNFSLYSILTSTVHIWKLEIHPRNCNASYTIRKFNPLRRVAHAFRSNIHYKALSKNKHFTTIPSQNVTKAILYAIYTFMHIKYTNNDGQNRADTCRYGELGPDCSSGECVSSRVLRILAR